MSVTLLPCFKTFVPNFLPISVTILFSLLPLNPIEAQIIPDNTLPINSSVPPTDSNTFVIDEGTPRGTNLFHSFEQFSIPTGGTAFFDNTLDIQNIFSRVTGGSVSNIDGIIRANGTANLFFINPKGIIFGPNAALNIGGSFLASTANSINFADGTQFSTLNPQSAPILTVTVPVGLGFGSNPGAIRVQGTGHQLTVDSGNSDFIFPPFTGGISASALRVQSGQTLALVGGDVILEGGTLTAESGQIELGSVSSGIVSLNPILSDQGGAKGGFTLTYEDVPSFRNIQLSQQALVDASGIRGGSIRVQGGRVTITDGSLLFIENQQSQPSGNISLSASESLELRGTNPDTTVRSALLSQNIGDGPGGDITVSTTRLVIQGGAQIAATSFKGGSAGNVTVDASNSVQVIGASINPNLTSNISSTGFGLADTPFRSAGNVTVSTQHLSILDGGSILSATFGNGNGGDVIVNATESIQVIGLEPRIVGVSAISASTLGSGNAGSLTINTDRLVMRDGGRVDASTLASGKAGSVTINARDSVEVSGTVPGSLNPSVIISSANIVDEALRQFLRVPPVPSGDSGNVTINTPHLSVTDGAQVTVRNDGTGKAGTLIINADSILLDNQGGITASTNAGESAQEGSITLNVRNSLQMRRNSVISAEAGGDQRGGNIIINAGAIAAVPAENSDITASAPQGTGGRITINTQGIFGFNVTQQPTPTSSDITAFGKNAEFNGIVQVNTPEIDVQDALNQLNTNFFSTEQAIASSCLARRNVEQGSFTSTGTGGLPTTPYDAQGGRYPVTQVQSLPHQAAKPQASAPTPQTPSTWKLGDPIQEAQGISVTPDGRIIVGTHPQLAALKDPQSLICHPTQVEE